jgi:hypothetical protein
MLKAAALAAAITLMLVAAQDASAACRDDLVAADKAAARSREQVQKAAGAAPAAQCAAYRAHVASLNQVKTAFARCDTSANKQKNAAQVGATIAEVTKQMQASCKK